MTLEEIADIFNADLLSAEPVLFDVNKQALAESFEEAQATDLQSRQPVPSQTEETSVTLESKDADDVLSKYLDDYNQDTAVFEDDYNKPDNYELPPLDEEPESKTEKRRKTDATENAVANVKVWRDNVSKQNPFYQLAKNEAISDARIVITIIEAIERATLKHQGLKSQLSREDIKKESTQWLCYLIL